jgi:cytochrome bd-type quinol oxidase subunit 2
MQPLYKILVIVLFAGILTALGSALFQLSRQGGDSKKMIRALAIRVGLSIALFLLLMILWYAGIIAPHGLS